jgi:hypothetical protein
MNRGLARLSLFAFTFGIALLPSATHAQVANFVFVSDLQTVAPGVPSQPITLQAQSSGGTSVNIPSTACISLSSTSGQGQFSSNSTNWSPISVLTMSKNTANKNFFYQDSQAGTPTLTVKIALKPDTVTSSCASWSIDQWSVQWTATQAITIGAGATSDSSTSATSSDTTGTQAQTQSTPPPAIASYVAPPSPLIFADAGSDRTVIVGADTEFDARAYNKSQDIVGDVRFLWNFGDGATAEGSAVLHHFSYPGRYAVVLDIAENTSAASDELIVTAEPARLAFKALPDSGVEIDNLAGRDLDLSGWLVRPGAGVLPELFTLPPHSIILSGSSMHISRTTLGFEAGAQAELQYPNGVEVLQAGQNTGDTRVPSAPAASAPLTPTSASPRVSPVVSNVRNTIETSQEMTDDSPAEQAATDTQAISQAAVAGAIGGGWNWWWVAAIGLSVVAAGALLAAQYFGNSEWNIIEEKPEAE